MKEINALKESYEKFEILGRQALFTNLRLDRSTIPEGIFAYDVRDECDGEINQLKSFVFVNHWGTVLVKEPIENADAGVDIEPDDYTFGDGYSSIEEFMAEPSHIEEPQIG